MRFPATVALTGALLASLATFILHLPYEREVVYGMEWVRTATNASAPITAADSQPYTRRNLKFDCGGGVHCDAWFYEPIDPASDPAMPPYPVRPIVIMGHGLGAQKEMGLQTFAAIFAAAGMGVLVFDYRTFGGSEGLPRHWVSPARHLEDWRSAVKFATSGALGPDFDTERVALWGTSFAGGHVLVTAADLPPGSVSAIISMVPHLDGMAASRAAVRRRGLPATLRLLAAGLHDKARALAVEALERFQLMPPPGPSAWASFANQLRVPAYLKLVGTPSELAIMQLSDHELQAYFSKHPKVYEGGWRPLILARFALESSSYRPITSLHRLATAGKPLPPDLLSPAASDTTETTDTSSPGSPATPPTPQPVPILFVAASKDGLCPIEAVRAAAAAVPGAEYKELKCSHFDAYRGVYLEQGSGAMVRFLRKHLLGKE
ncbi:hypothetical protein HYH03_003116 [Edaphochlamys debaryana]|uniref:Serine aminopeptidase S33 domain-containing protein n=1 Tax=Edaphochlamys debaryana TaxID=47281 RepID=A0A836C3B6_9CHLO|nr:hypothetical protein HYH03_003116 [Edaphochlamys debaryana]|eukprot:KAG2498926.1 hypothetical protein HYH03_003116 [Edaphochlamys debaryana]